MDTGGKGGALDVEEKGATGLHRPPYIPKQLPQVLNVVQRQIGCHHIPSALGVLAVLDPTVAVYIGFLSLVLLFHTVYFI